MFSLMSMPRMVVTKLPRALVTAPVPQA